MLGMLAWGMKDPNNLVLPFNGSVGRGGRSYRTPHKRPREGVRTDCQAAR
jgi:hypothetical protein